MNRVIIVWLAFLGVFAAGAVTGGVIVQRVARTVVQRRASEQFTEQQFKRVGDQLGLTDEQRARIRPIITTAAGEIQLRRRENLAILEKMETDIRAQLTPEQEMKFDQIRARQHDNERMMQRWLREQRRKRLEALSNLDAATNLPSSAVNRPAPAVVAPSSAK